MNQAESSKIKRIARYELLQRRGVVRKLLKEITDPEKRKVFIKETTEIGKKIKGINRGTITIEELQKEQLPIYIDIPHMQRRIY